MMKTFKLVNTYTGASVMAEVVRETKTQYIVKSERPIEGLTEHRFHKAGSFRLFGVLSHYLAFQQVEEKTEEYSHDAISDTDLDLALELSEGGLKTDSWNQEIDKAIVFYSPTARFYVPFKGNLTKGKESKAIQSVDAFVKSKSLATATYGWVTKNITIRHTKGQELSSYTEEGASGSNVVYVVNIDLVDYL